MKPKVLHLVDDAGAGGVNRMLVHLKALGPEQDVEHMIKYLPRGRWTTPRFDADVIVSHLSICWRNLPLIVALRALHPGTPLVHVEHSYSAGFVAANDVPRRRFYALLRASYSLFDSVVAVSQGQADWLTRRELVEPGILRVIRPAVDLEPFFALPPRGVVAPKVVGLIGRLHRQKGFDLAITAFRQGAHDGLTLEIHGDGPERVRLEDLAGGDPRIRFEGFATDPAAAMARCDVIAMPSRWEPFGLVGLEAQAAGRPLICADVDGLADHRPGEALIVPGHSVDSWAAVFSALGETSMARRALCGRRHARASAARFDMEWRVLIKDLALGASASPAQHTPLAA